MKTLILILVLIFSINSISIGQVGVDNNGNPLNGAESVISNSRTYENNDVTYSQVINVIPSPNQSTFIGDIAFDGEYLWVEGFNEFFLHQISTVDGSIIRSIPTSVERPHGLTFDGNYLWLSDGANKIIQKIDTSNGNVIETIPTPADINQSYPGGLAWEGTNIWINDSKGPETTTPGDSTFLIDTNGAILQSYDAKGDYPTGLAFDGQYLWSSDNVTDEIYKIDVTTFLVIDTIPAPGGQYPNGLAFDGQYLWVSNNDRDSIYQIDLDPVTSVFDNSTIPSNQFTVQPNPSSGRFIFKRDNNSKGNFSIIIHNIKGQIILNKDFTNSGSAVIELDEFNSNLFFYTVLFEDGTVESGKLIKE